MEEWIDDYEIDLDLANRRRRGLPTIDITHPSPEAVAAMRKSADEFFRSVMAGV